MADQKPHLAEPRKDAGRQIAQRSLVDIMKTEEVGKRFERYAPTPELGRGIHTSVMLALQQTPKLLQAPPLKLMQACFGLCRLGLEINTPRQHAFVIPFNGRAQIEGKWQSVVLPQVVVGYRGFIYLAHQTGKLVSVGGNIAVDGDDFDYAFGTKPFLRHRFGPARVEGEGAETFAYMTAQFKDGETFDVMSWPSILRIRDRSQGYQSALAEGTASKAYEKNPWVTDAWQMGVKTVIRRKSKTMDLSPSIDRAALMDEMGERGEADYGSLLDLDPQEWRIAGLGDEPTGDQHQVKTDHSTREGEAEGDDKKPPPKTAATKKADPAKPVEKSEASDPRPEPPADGTSPLNGADAAGAANAQGAAQQGQSDLDLERQRNRETAGAKTAPPAKTTGPKPDPTAGRDYWDEE